MLAPAYKHLSVYRKSMQLAMEIFESSKTFPPEERFGLQEQIRTSSRLICAHLAEAWQNRDNIETFIKKLIAAEEAVSKTRTWSEFAFKCGYWNTEFSSDIQRECNHASNQIRLMIKHAQDWITPGDSSCD